MTDNIEQPVNEIVVDGRMAFREDVTGSVPISPYLTINLSRPQFTGTNLMKCYPNASGERDVDAEEALAVWIAGMTHNDYCANVHTSLDKQRNILTFTPVATDEDPSPKKRVTAITIPKAPLRAGLAPEEAVLAITSTLGLGGKVQGPLVNSGFRVELERPTGDDAVLLDEFLLRKKGEFGRMTYGASIAYSSVYMNRDIVNLAFRKITRTNLVGVSTPEAIRKHVKHDDYPTLVLLLITSMLHEGFDVNVPCLSDDTKCNHILTGVVNPARMFTCDQTKLTDKQLDIITRPISMPVTQVEASEYIEEFVTNLNIPSFYEFARGEYTYRFNYHRPFIDEFILGGIEWAQGVNALVQEALKGSNDASASNRIINRNYNLNSIAQFAAWFKSIVVRDTASGEVLTTVDAHTHILQLLKSIITDEQIRAVFDHITVYIFNGNPVVIGVPNINCPHCNNDILPDNSTVVPVDIDMLFFTRISDQAVLSAVVDGVAPLNS